MLNSFAMAWNSAPKYAFKRQMVLENGQFI